MDPTTRLLHTRIDTGDGAGASVTPLYQTSGFSAGSTFFYTRKDNPNVAELELCLRELEEANHAVCVTCGMTAIYMVLDLLRPGDRLVANRDVYGCSFKLLQRTADRRNLDLHVLDLSRPEERDRIPEGTRMVFFETPTNPFLKTVPIRAVSERVKARDPEAIVVVDNTWATPLCQKPLQHGADISLHSGTKYLSGHTDVMSGVLLTDRDDLNEELRQLRFYGGFLLAPANAWTVRGHLQTLAVRVRTQGEVTRRMRDFVSTLPQVRRVYYPEVDGEQLTGYGGILFFELREDLVPRYDALVSALTLFGTGTGMACVTSMVAQPYTGSHASMTDEEKAAMGLGRGLVRLCFGLEDPADLREDLKTALAEIDV